MKEIIATEQIKNSKNYTIKIVYWYADGTKSERSVFIPPKRENAGRG